MKGEPITILLVEDDPAHAGMLLQFEVIMPKMNGKEASDEIQKIKAGVKTIFASGYAPDLMLHKMTLDDGSFLITKPVSPRELMKTVRGVLDGTLVAAG